MLRAPQGWAIQSDLYNRHRDQITRLEIFDTETGEIFKVTAERFDRYKLELNRGYGRQYALPLSYWNDSPPEPMPPPPPEIVQDKLF